MQRSLAVLIASTLALSAISSAHAERVRLRPTDRDTVVIVEFEPATGQPPVGVQLSISPQSPNVTFGDRLNARTAALLTYSPGEDEGDFAVSRLMPGNIKISGVNVTNVLWVTWMTCYADRFDFDAAAGEAVFIGRVSSDAIRAEAVRYEAQVTPRAGTGQYLYIEARRANVPLTPPSELPGWEERVSEYLRAHHPNMTAPVRAAELHETAGRCVSVEREGSSYLRWEAKE
jgi:hypothetical protein